MAGQKYNAVSLSLKLGKKKGKEKEKPAVEEKGASGGLPQDWPPSLQAFVSKSFAKAAHLEESGKTAFNRQIQQVVEQALKCGRLWENDWLKQKLPVLDPDCAVVQLECMREGEGASLGRKGEGREGGNGEAKSLAEGEGIPKKKGNTFKKSGDGTPKMNGDGTPKKNDGTPKKNENGTPKKNSNGSAKGSTSNTPKSTNSETPRSAGSQNTPKRGLDLEFDSLERKKQRMQRFTDLSTPDPSSKYSKDSNGVIIGMCQNLEKNYLRLTSEPDPARVRPQDVLQKSVVFITKKYADGASYAYFNDQFRSIRQDLTVQHIRNDFTQLVYETHARTAIENSDLGEYNQCQSQLKYLYYLRRQKLGTPNEYLPVEMEFICYRILYMLMTGNHSEIYKIRLEIYSNAPKIRKPAEKELYTYIKKAFELQAHLIQSDYHLFFEVYEFFKTSSLKLAYHLIKNYLVAKERVRALVILTKGYRKVPLLFLTAELKLSESTQEDAEEAKISFHEEDVDGFLQKHRLAQFIINGNEFDCVASRAVVQSITVQTGFRKIDIKGQV